MRRADRNQGSGARGAAWRTSRITLAVVAILSNVLHARGGVLLVDQANGPGTDFTQIQPAITAAVDGDVILVRPGYYQRFSVFGKSLSIVVDGSQATVYGEGFGASVSAAAGGFSLVRGFDCDGQPAGLSTKYPPVDFSIQSPQGPVWAESITTTGAFPGVGITSTGEHRVTLVRTVLVGAGSALSSSAEGNAIALLSAKASLIDCSVIGGNGTTALPIGSFLYPAASPVEAARVWFSELTLARTSVFGGQGGAGYSGELGCSPAKPGGVGAQLLESTIHLVNSSVTSGPFGALSGCETELVDAPAFDIVSGQGDAVYPPTPFVTLEAPAVAREGETIPIVTSAGPGIPRLLLVSTRPADDAIPVGAFHRLVGDPFWIVPAGASSPTTLTIPHLPSGVEALPLFLQIVTFEATIGGPRLGGGSAIVLLDESF